MTYVPTILELFSQSVLTESEVKQIETEYAREGYKTAREDMVFVGGQVYGEKLVLYRDQYGDGWEMQRVWEIGDHG